MSIYDTFDMWDFDYKCMKQKIKKIDEMFNLFC